MAQAWMRAIRGYKAKQTMAHLSKSRWNYLGKRLQQGRGLNQAGGFGDDIFTLLPRHKRRNHQRGSGIGLAMLGSWVFNKIRKKIQGGSGKRRRKPQTRRRDTHTLLTQ